MKRAGMLACAVMLIMLLLLPACSNIAAQGDLTAPPEQPRGQIYLYGEQHSVEKILDKELELWNDYYHNKSMRHLFIEMPYYTGEYLNLWMKSDSDEILDAIYDDWSGTAAHSPDTKEFYKKIKSQCPETIFHGTDVGHQYYNTGDRFLAYLIKNNLKDSEQYRLTKEAIEQGKYYYKHNDTVYRENKMSENFIREFDKLSNENTMGIYGAAHTGLDAMDITNTVPCMAKQLKKQYGDAVHSEDIRKLIDPVRTDTIKVDEKDYKALYYGKQDMKSFSRDYTSREFWRLENAYDDFRDRSKTGDVLPYDNYPMLVEKGQVFVIDYTKTDGTVVRKYYRSDGYVWKGKPWTEEFVLDD